MVEEVIRDQRRRVQLGIVAVAILHNLDGRRAGPDRVDNVVHLVRRRAPRKIAGDAHGDLALDAETPGPTHREGMAAVPHIRLEHPPGTRVGNPEVGLHDRRGTTDLPAGLAAEAGRAEQSVRRQLDPVGVELIDGGDLLR